jgi:hypothetical protein
VVLDVPPLSPAAELALEPLAKFKDHPLYPRASGEVLATKRRAGVNAARMHAYNIADAMADQSLERYLR